MSVLGKPGAFFFAFFIKKLLKNYLCEISKREIPRESMGMDNGKTVWAEKTVVIEDLMTIQDVARITRFKVCTIRKFVLKDTIPFLKVGGGLRFRPSEIAAWLNETGARGQGKQDKPPELFDRQAAGGREDGGAARGDGDEGHR